MKRFVWVCVLMICVAWVQAQPQPERKFDPARFDAELEQFITVEAGLSPQQAAKFFPLYKEMQNQQRVYFNKMRMYQHVDTRDNAACAKAIKEQDKADLQIKKIQQEYHQKFCKIMPAGLVMRIIKADEKFHREAFKRVARRRAGR